MRPLPLAHVEAPLVDGADGEAEPEEDPLKWAEREVAEAEELRKQWEAGDCDEEIL